jgi:hypothetical protein
MAREVTMTATDSSWSELGERLEALALKLKMHVEQSGSGEATEAMSALRKAVGDAFDAAGNAVRDDAVRADVREAGRLLGEAVQQTFAKVSGEVKEFVERRADRPS